MLPSVVVVVVVVVVSRCRSHGSGCCLSGCYDFRDCLGEVARQPLAQQQHFNGGSTATLLPGFCLLLETAAVTGSSQQHQRRRDGSKLKTHRSPRRLHLQKRLLLLPSLAAGIGAVPTGNGAAMLTPTCLRVLQSGEEVPGVVVVVVVVAVAMEDDVVVFDVVVCNPPFLLLLFVLRLSCEKDVFVDVAVGGGFR